MTKNDLIAALHIAAIDAGTNVLGPDEYDKMLENMRLDNMRRQQEAEQDVIDQGLNERANNYRE